MRVRPCITGHVSVPQLTVQIINDNQWEPDEEFFLKVSLLPEDREPVGVEIGRISIMEITILNDDGTRAGPRADDGGSWWTELSGF